MLLSDLIKHIPAQTKAISRLSSGVNSTTRWCTAWEGFRKSLWGKGLGSFEQEERAQRDDKPVRGYPLLPSTVATIPTTLAETWNTALNRQRFLVRTEYKRAEKVALRTVRTGLAFVVTGRSGSGPFLSFSTAYGGIYNL